ncbi:Olfactory receptor 12D3 [Fukomys damarensis]|uniref:Olfactory receptor 12D3 n=1 Tax=Fukomys damarensis TaxID=885580 RepID=A0A091D177_FUKDA|nr:Olfactory receptor 12D3 [Fukomys damarensis]
MHRLVCAWISAQPITKPSLTHWEIGNQAAESLAELCTVRTAQAGRLHTLTEPLEQAFLDSCPINGASFPDPTRACISSLQEGMLGSPALGKVVLVVVKEITESLYGLQGGPTAGILGGAKGSGPLRHHRRAAAGLAPAQAEVSAAEPMPAPPAAPCPAPPPQPEPAPGTPSPPAAQLGLPVPPQRVSAPELPLGPAPAPGLPFPSIIVGQIEEASMGAFLLTLLSYFYIISFLLFKNRSCRTLHKALSTCASHFMVVCLFYGPVGFTYIRPASAASMSEDRMAAIVYSAVTPVLNPLIYTLRNKEVMLALRKSLGRKLYKD